MATPTSQAVADQLRALAHPTRLDIVRLLGKPAQRNLSVTEIYKALDLPQAVISQHLITLKDRNILKSDKQSTKIYYSIAHAWVMDVVRILDKAA